MTEAEKEAGPMTARERAEAARVQYAGTVFDEPWIAGLYDALTDLLAETAEGGVGCGDGGGCAGRGGGAAMSDRMPTTEEVREAYEHGAGILPPFYDPAHVHAVAEHRADFDRWLAAYTAEKQAEALRIARDACERQTALASLVAGRPSDFEKAVMSCMAAIDAEAQRLREQATNQEGTDDE